MDLTLRPTTLEDLPILFEHQADPIGAKMAAFASKDWDAFVAHEAKIRDDPAAIRRTIVIDGEVVGSIGCWGDDEREIGYWIDREHWGRGIATASVRAFIAEIPDRPLPRPRGGAQRRVDEGPRRERLRPGGPARRRGGRTPRLPARPGHDDRWYLMHRWRG
jgi:hypothetical protein